MTYKDAVNILKNSGIESPSFDAAELFYKFTGTSRIELFSDPTRDYTSDELTAAVEKRAKRIPLQYILGEWEFFGLTVEVSEACLCPRADTEIIIEEALKLIPPKGHILELCTGSGCIPIALCHTRPDISTLSTDIFDETLDVARRNAEKNSVSDRARFIKSDIFARDLPESDRSFDLIVSNPPYIPTDVIPDLSPEVHHEPHAALDGGNDGLMFYREILGHYKSYLNPSGAIVLEIGCDQGEDIAAIAEENAFNCSIVKDLGGNDRCAVCRPK